VFVNMQILVDGGIW